MATFWPFAGGMLLGIVVGLALDRAILSWMGWQEWRRASREARLTDRMLTLLDCPDRPAEAEEPGAVRAPRSEASSG